MYQIIIVWNDCSCKTERTDDIHAALGAVEIFLEDPNVCDIHIYDWNKKKDIFEWSR